LGVKGHIMSHGYDLTASRFYDRRQSRILPRILYIPVGMLVEMLATKAMARVSSWLKAA
jgi:hypothetical protein